MAAPKVYDWQSNQWMLVPDHEVTAGVAGGRYSFEDGIDVPVVDAAGNYGTMPSAHVQDAFDKGGYRWATDDDMKAWQARQSESVNQDVYGNQTPAAFGQGFAKGYVPGATAVMEGMGALVGHGADVAEGLRQTEARNPGANFAGEMAGALSSPIVGAATEKAGALGTEIAGKVLGGTADGIVSRMATKAVGSSLEGAYFGLHDAVNESALGDPGEIAENLMAGAGSGLIFGGALGAGFEAAKMGASPIKKLFTGATDFLSSASEKAAEAAAKGAILPTLPAEMRAAGSAAIDDKAARDLYFFGGGKEAIEKANGELASTAEEVASQAKALKGELNYTIKGAPKEIQAGVNDAIDGAGGDLYEATKTLFADHEGKKLALDGALAQSTSPGVIFSAVDHDSEGVIKKLEKYGDSFAKAKAGEIESFLEAQKVGVGLPRVYDGNAPYENLMSSGKEVAITQELRERALAGIDKLPDRAKAVVKDYVDGLSYTLYEHPEFGGQIKAMDTTYEALDKLRSFTSDRMEGFNKSIVGKLKADPEYAAEFDAIMKRFPDVAPQLQEFRASLGNAMAEQVHLNQIRQAIRDGGAKTYGRMGADDFAEIAKAMGREDIGLKAERLKALQSTLIDQNAGPLTKYASYLRVLGREVPESVTKFEGSQTALERLHQLTAKASDGSFLENLMAKGARGTIKSALMGGLSAAAGAAVGHTALAGPVGYVAGSVAGGLVKKALNPASTLATLTRLEAAVNKSYQTIDKAVQYSVDALTSDTAKTVALAAHGFTANLPDRKSSFKARNDYLTQLQNPDFRAATAASRIGSAEGAPNITAAVHGQYSRGVNFLASKAPVDPMAHQSIMADQTNWKPSDMELAKYERYVDAVENPVVALTNIGRGRASSEEIETLKTVYPTVYGQLQDRVLDAIMKPDLKLSYSQRMQIGTLFDMPTDASMRPNFIAAMQTRFQNKEADGPKPGSIGSSPPAKPMSDANQTAVDRITFK